MLNSEREQVISPDKNVEAVVAKLRSRSKVGLEKYRVTTERANLSIIDWIRLRKRRGWTK